MNIIEGKDNFDYHFARGLFKEGISHFKRRAAESVAYDVKLAELFFCREVRLLLIDKQFAEAKKRLENGRFFSDDNVYVDNLERTWLSIELIYQIGRLTEAYGMICEVLEDLRQNHAKEEYRRSLAREYLGARIHHTAGKILARLGDRYMARIHYGFALSYAESELRRTQKRGHFIVARIHVNYCRTILSERNEQFVFVMLDNAEKELGYFLKRTVPGGNPEHVYYADLEYMRGRVTAKLRNNENWLNDVMLRAKQMEGVLVANYPKQDHQRFAQLKFLMGYAHLRYATEMIDANEGHTSSKAYDELKKAAAFFEGEENIYDDRPSGDVILKVATVKNYQTSVQRLLAKYYLQQKNLLDAREALKRAENFNRLSKELLDTQSRDTSKPTAGSFDQNPRLLFKAVKQGVLLFDLKYKLEVRNDADRNRLFTDTRIEYGRLYNAMISNFRWLTAIEATKPYLFDFRTVQEAIFNVGWMHLEALPNSEKTVVEVLLNVFADGQRKRWIFTTKSDLKKGKLEDRRRLQNLYLSLFHSYFEYPLKEIVGAKREQHRESNKLAWRILKHHLKMISGGLEKRRRKNEYHKKNGISDLFNYFNPNDKSAIILMVAGRDNVYALDFRQLKGESKLGMSKLRRISTNADSVGEAIKKFNSTVEKLFKETKNGKGPISKADVAVMPKDHIDEANMKFLEASKNIYDLLLKDFDLLGDPDLENIYLLFNHESYYSLPLGALCTMLPKDLEYTETRVSFADLGFIGSQFALATTNSIDDFFDRDTNNPKHELLPDISCLWTLVGGSLTRTSNSRGDEFIQSRYAGINSARSVLKRYGKDNRRINNQFPFNAGAGMRHFPKPIFENREIYGKKEKEEVLKSLESTQALFSITHVYWEASEYINSPRHDHERNKWVLHEFLPSEENDVAGVPPWSFALNRSKYVIYHEEIERLNLHRMGIAVLLGCSSAAGTTNVGSIPYSILSAFIAYSEVTDPPIPAH